MLSEEARDYIEQNKKLLQEDNFNRFFKDLSNTTDDDLIYDIVKFFVEDCNVDFLESIDDSIFKFLLFIIKQYSNIDIIKNYFKDRFMSILSNSSKFRFKIDLYDLSDIIGNCDGCKISYSDFIQLLEDPYEIFIDSTINIYDCLGAINFNNCSESLKKLLLDLNIIESDNSDIEKSISNFVYNSNGEFEDIINAIQSACDDSYLVGTSDQASEDALDSIKDLFNDVKFDGEILSFDVDVKDAIDAFYYNDDYDYYEENINDLRKYCVEQIFIEKFKFDEPYHGWGAVNSDVFLDKLEEELDSLV